MYAMYAFIISLSEDFLTKYIFFSLSFPEAYQTLCLLPPDDALSFGSHFECLLLPVDPVVKDEGHDPQGEDAQGFGVGHLARMSHHEVGRERIEGLQIEMKRRRWRILLYSSLGAYACGVCVCIFG